MDNIRMEGITKGYPEHPVLKDLSLSIKKGECFTLLGPSGCGRRFFCGSSPGSNRRKRDVSISTIHLSTIWQTASISRRSGAVWASYFKITPSGRT